MWLLALIVIFHFPLSTAYVWDDTLLIELNPWKRSLSTLPFVWTHHLWQDIPGEHISHWYRPLMGTHIVIDQILFGDAVRPKQWMSVLWFGTAMLLLHKWLQICTQLCKKQSFWIVCILVVHPFSLELTQFIAARNDTMALTLALCATLRMTKERTWQNSCIVGGLTFLTLASKESGLVWLGLLGFPMIKRCTQYRMALIIGVCFWFSLKYMVNPPSIQLDGSILSVITTVSHSSLWSIFSTSPLQPVPTAVSWFGIAGILIMVVTIRSGAAQLGMLIFLVGAGLAALAAEQSNSLGFRYLWLPLMGQTLWVVSQIPKRWLAILLLPAILGGVNSIQSRSIWRSNDEFWEAGYAKHPNQHTACGSFMQQRPNPVVALERLKQSIIHPPQLHCCAQASRYPFEIGEHSLSLSLGQTALNNGCPKIPELLAPMAMSAAIDGDWEMSMKIVADYPSDPFGYKPLLETAYGLTQNDSTKLLEWSKPENKALPNTTPEQRKDLLKTKAEDFLEAVKHSHQKDEHNQ